MRAIIVDGESPSRALAAALAARAVLHASFAVWLIAVRPPWSAVFDAGSWCGFADGTLGLLVAAVLVRQPSRSFDTLPARARWSLRHLVAGATLVDAVGRLFVSSALRAMPGLSRLPMVLVPLFAATGVSVTLLGAVMAAAWVMSRRGASRDTRGVVHALFDPLAMSAVVAFGAAGVLIVGPPATAASLRSLAIAVSATFAALFAVAALGVATLRSTVSASPAVRIWKL